MNGRRVGPTGAVGALVSVMLLATGCSGGDGGLGRRACPYLRPRLIRLDADRVRLPVAPGPALADMTAVAQDLAGYVRTNLPDRGRAASDRPLVRFSAALTAFVAGRGSSAAALDAAERPVGHECHVAGY